MLWVFSMVISYRSCDIISTNDISVGESFGYLSEGRETPQDGLLLNKLTLIINCIPFSPHLILYSYVAIF